MGLSCSVRPKKEIRKSQPQSTIYCCERDPKVWVAFMLRYFTRTLVRSILQLRTFQSYSEQSEKVMGCALITVTHEFIDTKMKVKCIISDYCELLSVTRRASFSARLLSMCFFHQVMWRFKWCIWNIVQEKRVLPPFCRAKNISKPPLWSALARNIRGTYYNRWRGSSLLTNIESCRVNLFSPLPGVFFCPFSPGKVPFFLTGITFSFQKR